MSSGGAVSGHGPPLSSLPQGYAARDTGDKHPRHGIQLAKTSAKERWATEAAAMNATIDKGIHRAIGFLEAGQIGEALACLRAMDAGCEASHLRCSLAGLVYPSAKQNSPVLE